MSASPSLYQDRESDIIAGYLNTLQDVVSCEVWERNGVILAKVSVTGTSRLSAADIQSACGGELGPDCVPQLVLLSRVERLVAAA